MNDLEVGRIGVDGGRLLEGEGSDGRVMSAAALERARRGLSRTEERREGTAVEVNRGAGRAGTLNWSEAEAGANEANGGAG